MSRTLDVSQEVSLWKHGIELGRALERADWFGKLRRGEIVFV